MFKLFFSEERYSLYSSECEVVLRRYIFVGAQVNALFMSDSRE